MQQHNAQVKYDAHLSLKEPILAQPIPTKSNTSIHGKEPLTTGPTPVLSAIIGINYSNAYFWHNVNTDFSPLHHSKNLKLLIWIAPSSHFLLGNYFNIFASFVFTEENSHSWPSHFSFRCSALARSLTHTTERYNLEKVQACKYSVMG